MFAVLELEPGPCVFCADTLPLCRVSLYSSSQPRTYYVAKAMLTFAVILLPQPVEYWEYRHLALDTAALTRERGNTSTALNRNIEDLSQEYHPPLLSQGHDFSVAEGAEWRMWRPQPVDHVPRFHAIYSPESTGRVWQAQGRRPSAPRGAFEI